ncbi:MAG: acyltransferase domain-containing protein [Duganella sp.]
MHPSSSASGELVFLFPGQGSQHYQMGRGLFDADPAFRDLMIAVDARYLAREGVSLLSHLYGALPARAPLDDIRLSHPLVVMIEYCLATVLRQRGVHPTRIIASSAGEFAAHAFAGRIPIDTALDMMARQAQWATAHAPPGFMLAAMASRAWCEAEADIAALATVAGAGMPSATVLTGPRASLAPLEAALRARGVAFHRLPVRVPFHSALMDPVRTPWMARYGDLAPPAARLTIHGQCDENIGYAAGLWQVIRQPFDFPAQLRCLAPDRPCVLVDVGPSSTLANWIRHGAPARAHWRIIGILSPWGGDVARLQQALDLAPATARATATETMAS